MDKPDNNFRVDLNEMIDDDIVMFSQTDFKLNKNGVPVKLYEGKKVFIYEEDEDEFGNVDNLISEGVIIKNPIPNHIAKWCCKMTEEIRHQSDCSKSRDD